MRYVKTWDKPAAVLFEVENGGTLTGADSNRIFCKITGMVADSLDSADSLMNLRLVEREN